MYLNKIQNTDLFVMNFNRKQQNTTRKLKFGLLFYYI